MQGVFISAQVHMSSRNWLADQDECTTAHKGGIKSYSDEKAMITEETLQTSKTELKLLPVSRNEENLIEEA